MSKCVAVMYRWIHDSGTVAWLDVGASKYAQRSRVLGGGMRTLWRIGGVSYGTLLFLILIPSSQAQPQSVLLGSGAS